MVTTFQICGHWKGLSTIKPPEKVNDTLKAYRSFFAHVAHPGFKAIDKFVTLFSKKLFNSVFNKP